VAAYLITSRARSGWLRYFGGKKRPVSFETGLFLVRLAGREPAFFWSATKRSGFDDGLDTAISHVPAPTLNYISTAWFPPPRSAVRNYIFSYKVRNVGHTHVETQRSRQNPCVDSAPIPSVQGTRLTPKSVLAVARMKHFAYSIGQ
jgi:hypothetical protein